MIKCISRITKCAHDAEEDISLLFNSQVCKRLWTEFKFESPHEPKAFRSQSMGVSFSYTDSPLIRIFVIIMRKISKFQTSFLFGVGNEKRHPQMEKQYIPSPEKQKCIEPVVNSPVPTLTIHSFLMSIFVSLGGFIFSYDIGQILGFL